MNGFRTQAVIFGLIMILVSSGAVAAADNQPGTIIHAEYVGRATIAEAVEAAELLFEGRFQDPPPVVPIDEYRLRYWSSDADGSPVEVEGSLFVPAVPGRLTGPVLAFGSGTTGVGDQCAPSLEQPFVIRWGYYRANMLYYAGQGIITIFPDYTGFNHPDIPQRYFSKYAEGYLMLDSLRVARNFFIQYPELVHTGFRPNEGNATAGYSQGGHAALAAADLVQEYAPDIQLDGAIGFGSTNSVEMLMKEAAYYTPEIIYTYQQIYGTDVVDPADFLQERWLPTLEEDVLRMCVDEFQYFYPFGGQTLYTPKFYSALHQGRLAEEFPVFKQILDDNESGLSGHGIPVLRVQGVQDIIITVPGQREYVERLRATGVEVELLELEEVRHRHTRPAGFVASVEFIKRVTAR